MELENTTPSMPKAGLPFLTAVMSHREIARELGITSNAVYEADKRALKKLRRILIRRLGAEFFGVTA